MRAWCTHTSAWISVRNFTTTASSPTEFLILLASSANSIFKMLKTITLPKTFKTLIDSRVNRYSMPSVNKVFQHICAVSQLCICWILEWSVSTIRSDEEIVAFEFGLKGLACRIDLLKDKIHYFQTDEKVETFYLQQPASFLCPNHF